MLRRAVLTAIPRRVPFPLLARRQFHASAITMSNAIQTVVSDELPAALGPYSHAVKAGGFAFLSGNIPITKAGDVVPGGAAEQTDQVCKNITLALKACGTELPKVVKVNIFLADMGDFAAVNEVYGKYFAHKPARSCVAVKELPKKVLVEIECIAAL